jgi:hypothetical protein
MADLHEMRARVRNTGYEPEPSRSGLPFWIATVCAVAIGFTVVLFVPRFYTPQRTAALPIFKDTPERVEPVAAPAARAQAETAGNPGRYAGKSADEVAKIADAMCPQSPNGPTGITFQSDRLHCLLTEGPARYCEPVQRSKITAAIINHFRIVEHAAKVSNIEVEPRIIVAIEGLIRAGYLGKAQRDDINTSVPREIRERFSRVIGTKAPCPEPPWWAVWK